MEEGTELGFFKIIYDCAGSLSLSAAFCNCGQQGLLSSCGAQASHCSGFSRCRAWALGGMGFSSSGKWALQSWLPGSRAQTQQFWPTARGIFPDQGWNLCLLHWQADSFPLSLWGSPLSWLLTSRTGTSRSAQRCLQSLGLGHSAHEKDVELARTLWGFP